MADPLDFGQNERVRLRRPILVLTLKLVLVAYVSVQLVQWGGSAPRMAFLQVKNLIFGLEVSELHQQGDICRRVGDESCAVKTYQRIVEQREGDLRALGYLGMAHMSLGNCSAAIQALDSYFTLGGDSALAWQVRGQCHAQLGQREIARRDLYRAVARESRSWEALAALVDVLLAENRQEEALSLLASLSGGHPERFSIWRERLLALDRGMRRQEQGKLVIRLPGLDPDAYYLPVRWVPDVAVAYLLVSDESDDTQIPRPLLAHWSRDSSAPREPAQAQGAINVSELQVGPWLLSGVPVRGCDDCHPQAGQSLLTRFDVYEEIEAGVRFLVLNEL